METAPFGGAPPRSCAADVPVSGLQPSCRPVCYFAPVLDVLDTGRELAGVALDFGSVQGRPDRYVMARCGRATRDARSFLSAHGKRCKPEPGA